MSTPGRPPHITPSVAELAGVVTYDSGWLQKPYRHNPQQVTTLRSSFLGPEHERLLEAGARRLKQVAKRNPTGFSGK